MLVQSRSKPSFLLRFCTCCLWLLRFLLLLDSTRRLIKTLWLTSCRRLVRVEILTVHLSRTLTKLILCKLIASEPLCHLVLSEGRSSKSRLSGSCGDLSFLLGHLLSHQLFFDYLISSIDLLISFSKIILFIALSEDHDEELSDELQHHCDLREITLNDHVSIKQLDVQMRR